MANTLKTAELKAWLRQPYAWPGGYQIVAVMDDGECVCHKCARDNFFNMLSSTRHGVRSGWQFMGTTIVWEGPEACAHCYASVAVYEEETLCAE